MFYANLKKYIEKTSHQKKVTDQELSRDLCNVQELYII